MLNVVRINDDNISQQEALRFAHIKREHRKKVLYAQDQITMAVYHKRPPSEIKFLLSELEKLTRS